VILLAFLFPAIFAEIPIAALDAGRLGWSAVPQWGVIVGYVLVIAASQSRPELRQ